MKTYRFPILIIAIAIAGMSQGLTLPLLSILLERADVPSSMNGWNASALYIGMFVTSLFIEKPARRFGYKPLILFGIALVLLASLLIPLWLQFTWWFFLRLLIGVGDSCIHYATQLWITSTCPPQERGRRISIYGLSYGAGFSIGPFGVNLLQYGIWIPFLLVALFYFIALLLVSRLSNEYPKSIENGEKASYGKTFRLGWYALIPAFLYGYLEAVLNGIVPIYTLRIGLHETDLSIILFAFFGGALLTQLPLGILSDRIGRKNVLMLSAGIAAISFFLVPWVGQQVLLITILFAISGCFTGSFFSLGLAYVADLMPPAFLPTANVLASLLFSLGSMSGPWVAGLGIQYIHPNSLFYSFTVLLGGFLLAGFVAKHGLKRQQK